MFEWIKGLFTGKNKLPEGVFYLGEGFRKGQPKRGKEFLSNPDTNGKSYFFFRLNDDERYSPMCVTGMGPTSKRQRQEEADDIERSGFEIYAPNPYHDNGPNQKFVDAVMEACETFYAPYSLERMYLIGSRARGEGREDSDHDFVVVLADDTPNEIIRDNGSYGHLGVATIRKSVKELNPGGSSPDFVFCRFTDFMNRKDSSDEGIPYKAEHEGVRLK